MIAPQSGALHVVLLGPPASGKGTQGRALASALGLGYLSTGALLREHVENETPLGEQAKPILARGEYLPDELMCPILEDWLGRQKGGWVLDGFPRSLPQAKFLADWLISKGQALDAAIALEVPLEQLLDRIRGRVECPECRWSGQVSQLDGRNRCPNCGATAARRADDEVENFQNRHREFLTNTGPVIDFYGQQGNLHRCDATYSQEVVAARLLALFREPGATP